MATKSFLKTVSLRDAKQCKDFIRALEKSESVEKKQSQSVRPARELNRDQIRKVFAEKDD